MSTGKKRSKSAEEVLVNTMLVFAAIAGLVELAELYFKPKPKPWWAKWK